MTILLSDPRVATIPLAECGEPMVALGTEFGPARAWVRHGVAVRLDRARSRLPRGIGMRVAEGHRTAADQERIIDQYSAEVAAAHPGIGPHERDQLVSRFVSPLAVAPHPAGAAVDVTLTDLRSDGADLDLGTPIDATPEQSGGACYFDAPGITALARAGRVLLAGVLGSAGMINYPTEWWHWSYGDRYWALLTRSGSAIYGPVEATIQQGNAAARPRRTASLAR
jgi:D-alanyl-D-alanine dipeptidase